MKREKKESHDRTRFEKQPRSSELNVARDISHLEETLQCDLADILAGKAVGQRICHFFTFLPCTILIILAGYQFTFVNR